MLSNKEKTLAKVFHTMASDEIERRLASGQLTDIARSMATKELESRANSKATSILNDDASSKSAKQAFGPVLIVGALAIALIWWLAPGILPLALIAAALICASAVGKAFPTFGRLLGWPFVLTPVWLTYWMWSQGALTMRGGDFNPLGAIIAYIALFIFSAIGIAIGTSLLQGASQDSTPIEPEDEPELQGSDAPAQENLALARRPSPPTQSVALKRKPFVATAKNAVIPVRWLNTKEVTSQHSSSFSKGYIFLTVVLLAHALPLGLGVFLQYTALASERPEHGVLIYILPLLFIEYAAGGPLVFAPFVWIYLWIKNGYRLNKLLTCWGVCMLIIVAAIGSYNHLRQQHLALHAKLLTRAIEQEDLALLKQTAMSCKLYCNFEDDSAPLIWLLKHADHNETTIKTIGYMIQHRASRVRSSAWLKDRRTALQVAVDRYSENPLWLSILLGDDNRHFPYEHITKPEGADLNDLLDYATRTEAPQAVIAILKSHGAGTMLYSRKDDLGRP